MKEKRIIVPLMAARGEAERGKKEGTRTVEGKDQPLSLHFHTPPRALRHLSLVLARMRKRDADFPFFS